MPTFIFISLLSLLNPVIFAAKQEPAAPAAGASSTQSAAPNPQTPQRNESSSNGKKKAVPAFLIIGTVFNEQALSFPGALVRIRRTGEKKYRWETYTNSRGEFAVRVPEGQQYEVLVLAKNYKDQSRSVTASIAAVQERLSIKLEPVKQEKTGAKP
jgi:hypothetical protein